MYSIPKLTIFFQMVIEYRFLNQTLYEEGNHLCTLNITKMSWLFYFDFFYKPSKLQKKCNHSIQTGL